METDFSCEVPSELHEMYAEQRVAALECDLLDAHRLVAELRDCARRLDHCRHMGNAPGVCGTCELEDGCDFYAEFDRLGVGA